MYNPLISDISKLKDTELEARIADITKKYPIAARMGHGAICNQMLSALSDYKQELQQRYQTSIQKAVKKQDKNFEDLINVE